jgi:hypothetical protein
MMADLVRNDVRLREIARRTEPRIEIVEEGEVEIDLLILLTVEGTHGRLSEAAG